MTSIFPHSRTCLPDACAIALASGHRQVSTFPHFLLILVETGRIPLRHTTTMQTRIPVYPFVLLICVMLFVTCKRNQKQKEPERVLVSSPAEIREAAGQLIREMVASAGKNNVVMPDSVALMDAAILHGLYEKYSFAPIWSDQLKFLPASDSLFTFIGSSKLFGLFPEDYHQHKLTEIRNRFFADSLEKKDRRDAMLWSTADILLTDAFIRIVKDVKLGRLPNDSITLRKDSVLDHVFYREQLEHLLVDGSVEKIAQSLEPRQRGYQLIRNGIKKFLEHAVDKEYTQVPSQKKDPVNFRKLLQKRLFEGGYLETDSIPADSLALARAIRKFQQEKDITVDGVAGEGTLRMLNTSDREKFIRIAISLDKYKMLPATMPNRYVWVNVPGYTMDLVEGDTVRFSSRIICGKAKTKTPLLNGNISAMITYPQWVPPPSIVRKEILPAVKKNPGYLAKKGFSLVNSKGEEVDPFTVDWSKYNNAIPYRVVQGSGDANALGIMKFHFDNKYSVYLHDTNQRYLFANSVRSLSHGCVRVQEWEKLAFYILSSDSASGVKTARIDSVKSWLQQKMKRNIAVRNKLPVFIRYITCEGRNGDIIFHDDPYGEDQLLRQKFFASK